MPYDLACLNCPYRDQRHFPDHQKTQRDDPPVALESNRSSTLIVAIAPGVEEWQCGRPLLPTKKRGGTAGARIKQSWDRAGKTREEFDIIEAVQCYPGRGDADRDEDPDKSAVVACSRRLRTCLVEGQYTRAIALGQPAYDSLQLATEGLSLPIVKGPHPNGGTRRPCLDRLWRG